VVNSVEHQSGRSPLLRSSGGEDIHEGVDFARDGEAIACAGARIMRHQREQTWLTGYASQSTGQILRVPRLEQQAVHTIRDQLGGPSAPCAYHWTAALQCLDGYSPKCFVVGAHQDDVCPGELVLRCRCRVTNLDSVRYPESRSEFLELVSICSSN